MCEYPTSSGMLDLDEVMPPFRWVGALDADGVATTLDLGEFHCNPEYDQYRAMILLVSAGWCSACPDYIRMLDGMSESLMEQGVLIAYLEVETADFDPADSHEAKEFIDGLIMDGPGFRIGDADNTEANVVRSLVRQFPSAYFIRRSDMKIVADQSRSIYTIDFGALAGNPEGTWTPMEPPFVSMCTQEETGEPNDAIVTARPITVEEGEVMGGICTDPPNDFYAVNLEGPWRFDLYTNYTMMRQDINLRLWTLAGERVGGSNQRSNHDWVDYEGPAVIEVYGEHSASDVYRVSLTAR
jgi:hypothetical protein